MENIKFEYGFQSINGIVKKKYYLHEIPNIKEKCDLWNMLPIIYVRQFTGVTDKNGVEIYEGDVYIVGTKDFKYTVVWHDAGFKGKIEYETGCTTYVSLEYWITHIEIIGNIYETKN